MNKQKQHRKCSKRGKRPAGSRYPRPVHPAQPRADISCVRVCLTGCEERDQNVTRRNTHLGEHFGSELRILSETLQERNKRALKTVSNI
jgi:hypothetical protein